MRRLRLEIRKMLTTQRFNAWGGTARLGLVLAIVSWSSASWAQHPPRNLSGVITDKHQEPLSGAIVQVQNGITNGVVSYITNRNGQYSFKRLDGDTDYRVWATWKSRRSKTKNLSLFDSKTLKTINFRIKSN